MSGPSSLLCVLILTAILGTCRVFSSHNVDNGDGRGYILFCPCMGRFGNQMDYFLGSLGFAKALNRTLVLPPWVEYRRYQPNSIQVPFDRYFRVDRVAEYHPVLTMEEFMKEKAPVVWPPSQRISFCYQERRRLVSAGESSGGDLCASKSGNPNGPFWDSVGVDFVGSELHQPLLYDTYHVPGEAERWQARYPPHRWPVLAFAGSPASYPVLEQNVPLQRYFVWSDEVQQRASRARARLPPGPYVAIHLRLGEDWVRACEHVRDAPGNLFSSAQCLGYRNQHGALSHALCYPPWSAVVRQVRRAVRQVKAAAVYVATDTADRLAELRAAFNGSELALVVGSSDETTESDPHTDLAVMARANMFIGNCVSSFSAVVKRERDTLGLPSGFWSFPPEKRRPKHTEL